MALLPFVVQPKKNTETVRLGNEEIGVIEIKRKGYLSVAEKTFVDNVMQGSDGVAALVQLANKISREREVSPEKAYIAITEVMGGLATEGLEQEVAVEYATEIAEISTRMTEAIQRRAIAATTVLIQTRINHEWTVQDTLTLDPELLTEFTALYDREEQREPVEPEKREEEAKEIVGK